MVKIVNFMLPVFYHHSFFKTLISIKPTVATTVATNERERVLLLLIYKT